MRDPGKRIRRLHLLVTILLGVGAVFAGIATASKSLQPQLGLPLTVMFTLLAVLWPTLEAGLKRAQALLDKQDEKGEERAHQRAGRSRADLIEQVRRAWVPTDLKGSSHEPARIELRLADHPAAVDNPLQAFLRRPHETDHPLQPGKPIGEVYRELGKELLILGEPGVGKTTLLLELTQSLLDEAEAATDQPMPVVFQLSSWAARPRPLGSWMVDELYKRYGVSRRLGQMWVDAAQVIPLLDGLDEVVAEHRDACVATINAFHDENGQLPLVVCSRLTEYEALAARLRLRGAILIQPLSRVEVDRYLRHAGRPLAGVRAAIRDDDQLGELLTTPLFLSIVALTYRDKSAADVRALGTLEERRRRLLADYIETMLDRPRSSGGPPQYSAGHTMAWLTWLGRTMRAHGQSLFYPDWMQPDWLPTPAQRRLVTIGTAVGAGLAVWAGFVLVFPLVDVVLGMDPRHVFDVMAQHFVYIVSVGPILGVVVGFAAYQTTIAPTDQLRWSRGAMRRKFASWLLKGGVGTMLVVGLLVGLDSLSRGSGGLSWLQAGLLGGLILALPVGLFFGLLSGLGTGSYVSPPAPGKALERSMRNGLISGLSVGLLVGLVFFALTFVLIDGANLGLIDGTRASLIVALFGTGVFGLLLEAIVRPGIPWFWGLTFGLTAGLGTGLIVGLQRGGGAYLRHQLLLRLLIRNRSIPGDYPAFLEHASGLILLRRRGGGYEFIHRLLLEHFASLGPSSGTGNRSPGPAVALRAAASSTTVTEPRPSVPPRLGSASSPAKPSGDVNPDPGS